MATTLNRGKKESVLKGTAALSLLFPVEKVANLEKVLEDRIFLFSKTSLHA